MTSGRLEASGRRLRGENAVVATVGFASLLVPLNSTMIAVALPEIMRDFDASVTTAGWLAISYLITMASLQPVAGKLGDRVGRKQMMLGGLSVFGVASVAAALTTGVLPLIAFRALQAVAAACAFPNGSALLREVIPEERRAARFGLVGSAIGLGAAAGPLLGGILVGAGGWQGIFWVNVPLVAIVLALGTVSLPRRPGHAVERGFDVAGAVMLSALLAAAAWLLNSMSNLDPVAIGAVVVALLGGGAFFVRYELRSADPVFQPRFYRRRAFTAATSGVALSNLSMYSVLLAVPLVLADTWSAGRIGLLLGAMSVSMMLFSPLGGWTADRLGRRTPATIGTAVLAVSLVPLVAGGADTGTVALVISLFGIGTGIGISAAAVQTSAIESVEVRNAGMAAAAFSTSRYLGSIVGTSVLAGVLVEAGPAGFRTLFILAAGTAAAATVAATFLPGRTVRAET